MVGLFLVLAIQLLQVQSGLASVANSPCAVDTHASCCCSGEDHCPCAESSPGNDSKIPLGPIPGGAKLQDFIKPLDEPSVVESLVWHHPEAHALMACQYHPIGFYGVSLSVAFCRFVI